MVGNSSSSSHYSIWDFKGKVPDVDNWFLMGSPVQMLTIIALYLIGVYVGPKIMKPRQPMNLKTFLIYYNIGQVLFSAYVLIIALNILTPHGLIDETCKMNNEKTAVMVTSGIYVYFLAKISEVLDTVFFILRKKQNQVTFLHVYHHAVMILFTWLFLKYEPTYGVVFIGAINSFVHVIMYGYYALSAFPSLTKYLWWKKYLTALQLIQFVMIIIHASLNYTLGSCPPSYLLITNILTNTSFFIYLFGQFYIQSYVVKSASKSEKGK